VLKINRTKGGCENKIAKRKEAKSFDRISKITITDSVTAKIRKKKGSKIDTPNERIEPKTEN
jgi:hypothetical protein